MVLTQKLFHLHLELVLSMCCVGLQLDYIALVLLMFLEGRTNYTVWLDFCFSDCIHNLQFKNTLV